MQSLKLLKFYILSLKYLPKNFLKYVLDISSIIISYLLAKYILHIPLGDKLYIDATFLFFSSIIVAYILGLYHHLWRFTSLYNTFDAFKFCFLDTVLLGIWYAFRGYETEQLLKFCLLFLMFSFFLLNFIRVLVRISFEHSKIVHQKKILNVIVIGAGKGGELFIRESRKNLHQEYQIEGIFDDDPTLWGKKLFGIKIYGPIKDIAKLGGSSETQLIVIAIPSLEKEKLLEITQIAQELGCPIKVLPSFDNLLINKHSSVEDVSIDDLLGRDSVNLDVQEVSKFIKDKTILITGGGGSIGSEICRQLIKLEPKSIIIVDHSEYNLYNISWELEHSLKYNKFIPILANVNDKESMEEVFKAHHPKVIFHAAAYKHVPLLERQAKKAVANNFLGTKKIAELASEYNVEKFILISTDKAVNPTNVMGSTKRMAEIFCQNFNTHSSTKYITVRFGNVLGSAGSVIPLFKKQLKQGGPLTVTHPEITRFFMSIPEASQLVLQAGAMGEGGEIFVLDMGSPIKISDLAERLISLSGKRPYKDVDIVFTGLRPGEKLYEELFYENEEHILTKRKKIFLAKYIETDFEKFIENSQFLEHSLPTLEEEQVIKMISTMIPEAQIEVSHKNIYGVDDKLISSL